MWPRLPALCASVVLLAAPVLAQREVGPDDYRAALRKLEPGVTLRLGPGVYGRGLPLRGVHGTAAAPIVIEGVPGKTVFHARRGHNTVQLTDASHIVIRDLTLDGRGLLVDAIKAGDDASRGVHHITIEGCRITGHDADQSIVGIATHVPTWDWIIRDNVIKSAGTGMYLGNSDGTCPFIGGVIERNRIEAPIGYAIQIKHQVPRARIPGMPADPRTTVIRGNQLVKTARRGKGDRPNLLLGGFPQHGPGSTDRYEVYGNVFFGNPREALFQGTGRFSLHDNLFVDCPETGIRVMHHNGSRPHLVRIYRNTFLRVARPWSLMDMKGLEERTVFGNLILDPAPGRGGDEHDVVVRGEAVAAAVRSATIRWSKLDLQPVKPLPVDVPPELLRRVGGDVSGDFFGRRRSVVTAGALVPGAARPIRKR